MPACGKGQIDGNKPNTPLVIGGEIPLSGDLAKGKLLA